MNHLLNILRGAGSALSVSPEPRKYHIERHGPRVDASQLRGDFTKLGNDLRIALKRDKQTDKRSR